MLENIILTLDRERARNLIRAESSYILLLYELTDLRKGMSITQWKKDTNGIVLNHQRIIPS